MTSMETLASAVSSFMMACASLAGFGFRLTRKLQHVGDVLHILGPGFLGASPVRK